MTFKIDLYDDIADFVNRLEKFDRDVSKELKKGLRTGAGFVASAAKSKVAMAGVPLSHWAYSWVEQDRTENVRNLLYSVSQAQGAIKPVAYRARKNGRTVAFGYYVKQMDPAASIFELAGSVNKVSKQSRGGSTTFNKNLLERYGDGPYPRILYPSYYAGMPAARALIEKAVADAARRVGL